MPFISFVYLNTSHQSTPATTTHSAPLSSVPLNSTLHYTTPPHSTPLIYSYHHAQPHSTPLHYIPHHTTPLHPIPSQHHLIQICHGAAAPRVRMTVLIPITIIIPKNCMFAPRIWDKDKKAVNLFPFCYCT